MSEDYGRTIAAELERALGAASAARTLEEVREVRVRALGRKAPMSAIKSAMGGLSPDERRSIGRSLNDARDCIEAALAGREAELEAERDAARLQRDRVDVTLPGRCARPGSSHPLTQMTERIVDVFVGMGYWVAEGPEVETDWFNFQALNIPEDHPARSMHDTLYVEGTDLLLRTHTSPVQIRAMQAQAGPPIYVIAPGRVFRRDAFDSSHSPCFHQVEGLAVDRGISLADLKGTLAAFARAVFGPEQRVRLRPSYFPFTEPSLEVDVVCVNCNGDGCSSCGRSGWMEVLGAGMVHPNVLRAVGWDPEEVSGFAFGMGVERIAMTAWEVSDIRSFFDNDQRFLGGFAG
ncbi:MAG: phenylalanine--tRNA ligase subunit alpha [Actinomycetota bacterium]